LRSTVPKLKSNLYIKKLVKSLRRLDMREIVGNQNLSWVLGKKIGNLISIFWHGSSLRRIPVINHDIFDSIRNAHVGDIAKVQPTRHVHIHNII
jgi:hypothetical protein